MQSISNQIWDAKYRFKDADKNPIDQTVQDTWERVADALSECEVSDIRSQVRADFFDALHDYKFLPAGRIIAGAGTERNVTLFNCFVMGAIPDSMDGIFSMLKEAALTMQQGGGIGYDFSTLRPKGALVKGVAADASGPLTFMDCWDSMCRTVMSAGSRRGAMMATMRCDHPDIMDFITAKKDPARLRMFNLSVLVTDDFMQAVKEEREWKTYFDGVHHGTFPNAKVLWDAIINNTYAQAEPGVIFIDRINKENNLRYCETISATNPCGEQPLPPYGACLLGSINLTKFVVNPFSNISKINFEKLKTTVCAAVRMMDNVVDVSKFPLRQQLEEAKNKRRIGLGVTGLADFLTMMRLTYGSDEAVQMTETVMDHIKLSAYETSVDLAKEKGAFPLFDADQYLAEGTHASTLPDYLKAAIKEHGIRNALLTSIAPTGTISLYAGNVSSGIEPIFAFSYERKVLEDDGSHRVETVSDYAVELYKKMRQRGDFEPNFKEPGNPWSDSMLPPYFVTAQTLKPEDHVRMQAAAQRHIDSSISKTINVPEDISFEDFGDVYLEAYDSGCKGCTTYRPNDVTGSILSVSGGDKPEASETAPVINTGGVRKRDKVLTGETYKLKFGDDPHALYITLTDMNDEDGTVRPFEIFINSKNPNHFVWTTALTRMISAVFRVSDDATFVVEELKEVFDPVGGAWHEGKFVPSVIAAVGGVIEEHMKSIGYIETATTESVFFNDASLPAPEVEKLRDATIFPVCQKCGSRNVKHEAGCMVCQDCGDSRCG